MMRLDVHVEQGPLNSMTTGRGADVFWQPRRVVCEI